MPPDDCGLPGNGGGGSTGLMGKTVIPRGVRRPRRDMTLVLLNSGTSGAGPGGGRVENTRFTIRPRGVRWSPPSRLAARTTEGVHVVAEENGGRNARGRTVKIACTDVCANLGVSTGGATATTGKGVTIFPLRGM